MSAVLTSLQDTLSVTEDERLALWKRLEQVRFAMLTTVDTSGNPAARPLTTQHADPGGILWFFVAANGHVASAVARNPMVGVTYADAGDSFYVALSGNAECVRDPAKAKELWNAMAAAWFPGGPDDPNLALLRVDIDQGDTWESKSGKLVQLLSIAKAAITRTPPQNAGEHRHFVA